MRKRVAIDPQTWLSHGLLETQVFLMQLHLRNM